MNFVSEKDYEKMWDNFRKDGCTEALSLIYYEHFDFLYDFALRYTRDRSLIEDSIQNIFGHLLNVITSYSIHYTKLYDVACTRAILPTCRLQVGMPV